MIKDLAKKFRASQPFNSVTTNFLKFFSDGRPSDFITTYMPRSGTVTLRLPGDETVKLWSAGDEWITNHVFWHGWDSFEPETCRLFFDLAKTARVTIDVGAHIGYYSLLAAAANRKAQVYGFEPLPMVYARLEKNIALNDFKNIKSFAIALGTHRHEAQFYYIADNRGCGIPSSSGLSLEFMSSSGVPLTSTIVPVLSLDEFAEAQALENMDLIKMDTEETEPDVLRGGMRSIRKFQPTIICEVLRAENPELEEILSELSYDFYYLGAKGPEKQTKIKAFGARDNYLFKPRPS